MRTKRCYVFVGGVSLFLCFIIMYCFPGVFNLHGGWHMFPRDWVTCNDGYRSHPSFTYLTYNILNNFYMRQYIDRYSSCDNVRDFMNLTIRQSHIMSEVQTMDPDIACFQEIDDAWYDSYWYPQLSTKGYDGMLGVDQSHQAKVGQAIFWKKKKFKMEFNEKHFYYDLVKPYVENTLQGHEQTEFSAWFKKRSLLLLAELEEARSGSKVIVGCTHISAVQAESPAMQTLQIALALQRMEAFSQTRNTKALIISGDFNTPPHYPAYQFIKEGQITADMEQSYEDKTPLHKLEPEMKKFALDVLNLMPTAFTHNLYLRSAYHTVIGGEPQTTCHGDYTLDYIWFTPDHLVISGILKEPVNSHLLQSRRTEACHLFASDHLPVQAQFYFIPPKS